MFYLQLHGMEFIGNAEKVPVIMDCIKKFLPRNFQHCFVSALTPGTHITPHYGPNNRKLRFHFPIMGCEGASLKAGGQTVNLQEGSDIQILLRLNIDKPPFIDFISLWCIAYICPLFILKIDRWSDSTCNFQKYSILYEYTHSQKRKCSESWVKVVIARERIRFRWFVPSRGMA